MRHGDPMGGGTFYGAPMRFFEKAATYTGSDCLIWPYARMGNGYAEIRIDGRATIASREMCRRIHGEPPTAEHEAAHSCGKGHEGCISPSHLRWATPQENIADQVIHGTQSRGETKGSVKLTSKQVLEIRRLPHSGSIQVARRYGVTETTIRDIWKRRTWAWLR